MPIVGEKNNNNIYIYILDEIGPQATGACYKLKREEGWSNWATTVADK